MNAQLLQQIQECPALPSMPAIALQVLELAQKDDSDIAEIARVITKDAALSGKILKTVNSSFYARSQKVATVSHAAVILGLQSVKTLVLGFSLTNTLSKRRTTGFKHVDYWRRSIYAATAARTIAQRVVQVQGEECFLAALLMDIGMLVLDLVIGEEYGRVVAKADRHASLVAVEDRTLGLNHAQVAQLLTEQWKLPPVLAVPIAHHHSADQVADPAVRSFAQVVELASLCADVFVDANPAAAIADVRALCAARQQMTDTDCDALLKEIEERSRETAPLFEISLGDVNYDQILKRANETLIELTLSTQREVRQIEEQAADLRQQNQKLKVQATTDGLTGLANRATFDVFVQKAFELCRRSGMPIAVLMFDLDRFKSINDCFGHPAGDEVLRAAGKIVRARAGKGHLAARYGGEEMVLVAPHANRAQAAALAEQVRRAISVQPVRHGKNDIPVTTSCGVAVLQPASPFTHSSQLLKAADLALYAAKQAGRNCVRVFGVNPLRKTA